MTGVTGAHRYGAPRHQLLKRGHRKYERLTVSLEKTFEAFRRAPKGFGDV